MPRFFGIEINFPNSKKNVKTTDDKQSTVSQETNTTIPTNTNVPAADTTSDDKAIHDVMNANEQRAEELSKSLEQLFGIIKAKVELGAWGENWKSVNLDEIKNKIAEVQNALKKPIIVAVNVQTLDTSISTIIEALGNVGDMCVPAHYINVFTRLAKVISLQRRSVETDNHQELAIESLKLLLPVIEWQIASEQNALNKIKASLVSISKKQSNANGQVIPMQFTTEAQNLNSRAILSMDKLQHLQSKKLHAQSQLTFLESNKKIVSAQVLNSVLDSIENVTDEITDQIIAENLEEQRREIENSVKAIELQERVMSTMSVTTPETNIISEQQGNLAHTNIDKIDALGSMFAFSFTDETVNNTEDTVNNQPKVVDAFSSWDNN